MRFDRIFSISSRIPLILALVIIILSSSLWYVEFNNNRDMVIENQQEFTLVTSESLVHDINERINLVNELIVKEWITHDFYVNPINQSEFNDLVSPVFNFFSSYQAINWINTSGQISLVHPYETNQAAINQSVIRTADGADNLAFLNASSTGNIHVTGLIPFFQGGTGIASYLPVIQNSEIVGFFNVLIRLDGLIAEYVERESEVDEYNIMITDSETEVSVIGDQFNLDASYVEHVNINFFNQEWELHVSLGPALRNSISVWSFGGTFLIGLSLAVFAGFSAQLLIRQNKLQEERFKEAQQFEQLVNRSERLNALGTMAGGLAHDFNNLLMSISANLSILRHLTKGQSTEVDEILQSMVKTIKKSKDLTQQILIFSRQQDLSTEYLDIMGVWKDALTIFESVRDKSISLELHYNHTLSMTTANPSRLSQCFINLLNNAHDAIEGPGYIEVFTKTNTDMGTLPRRIRSMTRLETVQGYFQIDIVDSGIGMTEETIAQIFDPFFSTKGAEQGTGLGLSIVHQYITSMGGDILVKSTPGVGTKFSVFIPLLTSKSKRNTSQNRLKRSELSDVVSQFHQTFNRAPGILIVEDEPDILQAVDKMLNRYSIETIIATDSLQALDVLEHVELQDQKLDVIISDINLPGKNGVDLVDELLGKYEDLQVLFISGYSQERIPNTWKNPFEFLQKPFEEKELLDKVESLLSRILKDLN